MHNAHLNIATENGEDKMAKSGGNFITLNTLRDKKIDPLALRYVFLGARYSTPLSFSWETLEGAETALNRIRDKVSKLPDGGVTAPTDFLKFINDDLDTPKALALISEILNSGSISDADKKETLLNMDSVLGLDLGKVTNVVIPEEVIKLMQERDLARANKDFAKSDEIRGQIESLGFQVKDSPEGTIVS
jgi:cysteinyl-tRNA synthetase